MGLAAKALIVLLILGGCFGAGWHYGVKFKQGEQDAAELARKDAAEEARRLNQTAATKLRDQHDEEVRGINTRLADGLERLRQRPERHHLPDTAGASCSGSTGAELSGPDGGFLERLAARADEQRAALAECQAWIEQVKHQAAPGS